MDCASGSSGRFLYVAVSYPALPSFLIWGDVCTETSAKQALFGCSLRRQAEPHRIVSESYIRNSCVCLLFVHHAGERACSSLGEREREGLATLLVVAACSTPHFLACNRIPSGPITEMALPVGLMALIYLYFFHPHEVSTCMMDMDGARF